MAINVEYGDIGSALGLALRGGQAIRQRQQQQQDTQFLDLVSQEQARADAAHAQEISQALGAQKTNADLTMDQRKMDISGQQNQAEDALKQQQIAQQGEETKARMAQSDALNQQTHQYQDADHQMKVQQFQDKQAADAVKENAIASLTPEQQNVVRATGRMPYVPNNAGNVDATDIHLLQAQQKEIDAAIKAEQTRLGSTMEGKLATMGGQPVSSPQLQALQQQKTQKDAEISQHVTALLAKHAPLAQEAAQSRAAQPQNGNTPGAGPSGSTPVVNTASEYAALPSGTKYVDAQDGKTYVKR